jgi:hypothetical protein
LLLKAGSAGTTIVATAVLASVVTTMSATFAVAFAPEFLAEIVEVVGLRFDPCSYCVGLGLCDYFLLDQGDECGFKIATYSAVLFGELLEIAHDLGLRVFPYVDFVSLSLGDRASFNKSGKTFTLLGFPVLITSGAHC